MTYFTRFNAFFKIIYFYKKLDFSLLLSTFVGFLPLLPFRAIGKMGKSCNTGLNFKSEVSQNMYAHIAQQCADCCLLCLATSSKYCLAFFMVQIVLNVEVAMFDV